jgi:hypothetical protein
MRRVRHRPLLCFLVLQENGAPSAWPGRGSACLVAAQWRTLYRRPSADHALVISPTFLCETIRLKNLKNILILK